MDGAYTQEYAVFITCGSGCHAYDHVSNEMWVAQENTSACQGDNEAACWIEAGYSTYSTDNPYNCTQPHPKPANCYFWGDERPYLGYSEHAIQNMGTYDNWASVEIYVYFGSHTPNCQHDASGDEWAVVTTTAEGNQYTDASTCNPIYPEHIRTGQELENSGANSPWDQFEYNQWFGTNGTWNYQGNPGVFDIESPEYADWNQPPSSQYPGGVLEACSCG